MKNPTRAKYLLCVTLCITPVSIFAAQEKLSSGYWLKDLNALNLTNSFPLQVKSKDLVIPTHNLLKRAQGYLTDPRLEPVYVSLPPPYSLSMQEFASSYAKSQHYTPELLDYLINQPAGLFKTSSKQSSKKNYLRVILNSDALSLMNIEKFKHKYTTTSHHLSIDPDSYSEQFNKQLLWQTKPFLSSRELKNVRYLLKAHEPIHINTDLLPEFAKHMLNTFVPYRGPNCFHAAVAFQEEALLTMKRTNLRKEPNHHKLMINHDELWHLLNWYFYEIDPTHTKLRYGDMLVFFELPEETTTYTKAEFRWIVHASTYLFNRYVFSKGSKSPNTPYAIKHIEEEWKTWSRLTKGKLAMKVFRRSFSNLKDKSPITNRTEWLF